MSWLGVLPDELTVPYDAWRAALACGIVPAEQAGTLQPAPCVSAHGATGSSARCPRSHTHSSLHPSRFTPVQLLPRRGGGARGAAQEEALAGHLVNGLSEPPWAQPGAQQLPAVATSLAS